MISTDKCLEHVDGDPDVFFRQRFIGLMSEAQRTWSKRRQRRNAGLIGMSGIGARTHYGKARLPAKHLFQANFAASSRRLSRTCSPGEIQFFGGTAGSIVTR